MPMNALFQPVGWISLFYLPAVVVMLWLFWTRRAHDAQARQPFTEQPLRLAGESTREKADELFEDGFQDMIFILLFCPLVGWVLSQLPGPHRATVGATGFVVVSIATAIVAFRALKKIKRSWQYRLGAKGEQVVGRELDRLMAQGYRVFHDMPFVGWNIDHVVVGPRGVFAVETKAWRKPPKDADVKAEVILDGDALLLPGKTHPHRKALVEANRAAQSLTKWIAKVAAEQVAVVPVVALPGWSLAIKRYGDIAVYSATNMSEHLPKRGRVQLSPAQIQRISTQVENQCKVGAVPISPS